MWHIVCWPNETNAEPDLQELFKVNDDNNNNVTLNFNIG